MIKKRHLLVNLQQVPEDEAEAIRELLYKNDIRFYETQAGRWRIGLAGIWLPDTSQKQQAEQLVDQYQQQRYRDAQIEREHLQQLGLLQSMLEQFYKEPVKVSAAILGIVAVLSISILPFI